MSQTIGNCNDNCKPKIWKDSRLSNYNAAIVPHIQAQDYQAIKRGRLGCGRDKDLPARKLDCQASEPRAVRRGNCPRHNAQFAVPKNSIGLLL